MRARFSLLLVCCAAVGFQPSIASAQTNLTLDMLRTELEAGDVISVTPPDRETLKARVLRVSNTGLDLRLLQPKPHEQNPYATLSLLFEEVRALERARDSARNGALIGAGIAASFTGAMFVRAVAIDRNEIGEWAPIYLAQGAALAGLGALVGFAVDAAFSRPHIRYESARTTRLK